MHPRQKHHRDEGICEVQIGSIHAIAIEFIFRETHVAVLIGRSSAQEHENPCKDAGRSVLGK
jgi:hypothetical protein